jgi:hypothetical protein
VVAAGDGADGDDNRHHCDDGRDHRRDGRKHRRRGARHGDMSARKCIQFVTYAAEDEHVRGREGEWDR